MLPATAQEMANKLGLPFRPDLLRSNDPAALDYQRRLGAAYLQEGLAKTGNVRDALRYYHGGPTGRSGDRKPTPTPTPSCLALGVIDAESVGQ
jgi:soluble lytic murein transglycosylase-like protein